MQGKHSQDPRLGDCGVAKWFIRVEICPGFPISHLSILPQNKSYCVLSKAKTKASVQSFCISLKLSPLKPMPSAAAQVVARSAWSHVPKQETTQNAWDECVTEGMRASLGGREKETERGSLFPWNYISFMFGTVQVLFQNDQSTSKDFKGFS